MAIIAALQAIHLRKLPKFETRNHVARPKSINNMAGSIAESASFQTPQQKYQVPCQTLPEEESRHAVIQHCNGGRLQEG